MDPMFNALRSLCVKQKLYKVLSEVKGEVETVIKTGRQIVQRQQTEQPKELDDRVTALKLLYNQLGSQVSTRSVGHTPPHKSDSVSECRVLLRVRRSLGANWSWRKSSSCPGSCARS